MEEYDFRDFYIGYPNHPRYQLNTIITDDAVRVIIQKYEMILLTNKGELLGDPDFGINLLELLFDTKVNSNTVRDMITKQISTYIPELDSAQYELDVKIFNDSNNYQEYMVINFKIGENEVNLVVN